MVFSYISYTFLKFLKMSYFFFIITHKEQDLPKLNFYEMIGMQLPNINKT